MIDSRFRFVAYKVWLAHVQEVLRLIKCINSDIVQHYQPMQKMWKRLCISKLNMNSKSISCISFGFGDSINNASLVKGWINTIGPASENVLPARYEKTEEVVHQNRSDLRASRHWIVYDDGSQCWVTCRAEHRTAEKDKTSLERTPFQYYWDDQI